MNNQEKAIELLDSGEFTCVLCKGDLLYTSKLKGIAPMIKFIDENVALEGFSAADIIVGKAAALLFVKAGIESVFAKTMSVAATEVFNSFNIQYSYNVLTEYIINRKGDGLCPMEIAVSDISSPETAFQTIKQTLNKLKSQ